VSQRVVTRHRQKQRADVTWPLRSTRHMVVYLRGGFPWRFSRYTFSGPTVGVRANIVVRSTIFG